MKTLYVLNNASGYGGAERNLELLLPTLSQMYRLVVFVENARHQSAVQDIGCGHICVVAFRKGKGLLATALNLWTLRRWMKSNPPSAVLANSNKAAFFMALYHLIFGSEKARILLYVHDFSWKHVQFILSQLENAEILVPSRAVLENTEYLLEDNGTSDRKSGGAPKRPVHVVPNVVDMPNSIDCRHDQMAEREPPYYVLCLAAIARLKGIDKLVRAFARISHALPDIRLVVCGEVISNVFFLELKDLIRHLKLEEVVEIRPYQDDVDALYRNSMFVVNASISEHGGPETFGRTIAEAWSYCIPAIAFNLGGPKYLIDDGQDGFLVDEGDIGALGERMAELAGNAELRRRMGRAGYKKVTSSYSNEVVIRALSGLIDGQPNQTRPCESVVGPS